MKDVIIFQDGKLGRGSRAKLIKRGNKRVLIEYVDYDYRTDTEVVVTEWFKLYISKFRREGKKAQKHNNKRKFAKYCSINANQFYSDHNQTEEFKDYFKDVVTEECYLELYGE